MKITAVPKVPIVPSAQGARSNRIRKRLELGERGAPPWNVWNVWNLLFFLLTLSMAPEALGQGIQESRPDCGTLPNVLNNECLQTTDASGRLAGRTYLNTGSGWIEKAATSLVNAQTGTTYTVLNSDSRKLVTLTNAGAIAVTLPQAGASSAFMSGWFAMVQNRGAGTVTITPTTSTIDGAASLALTTNQGVVIYSNGSNYFTMRGVGSAGGAGTDDQNATEVPYTPAVGANWGVDPDDVAEALDQAAARVTALEAASALLPGTYLDDQIPIHNGTVFQAKSIPPCADTGGQHLNYDSATNTVGCGTSSTGGVSGLTVGNLHKGATTSSFGPSGLSEDANSLNSALPVEIGNVVTNSLAHDTSAITGHKSQAYQNVNDTFVYRASTDTLINKTMDGASNSFTDLPVSAMVAALRTKSITFRIGSDTGSVLADTADEATMWRNNIAALTITEVICESDAGTPIINLQRDDGSPANILSSNLTCSTSGATGTVSGPEDNLAVGDKIDFVMVTAGGVAKRVTISIKATLD